MEGDTSLIKKLEVNTKFNSYEELKQSLTQFEKDNYIQLWKRDSRTIKCMKTRAPNKNFNNDLVYDALALCCVHGGKDHKTSSTGKCIRSIVH
jgi:hypothetical protein